MEVEGFNLCHLKKKRIHKKDRTYPTRYTSAKCQSRPCHLTYRMRERGIRRGALYFLLVVTECLTCSGRHKVPGIQFKTRERLSQKWRRTLWASHQRLLQPLAEYRPGKLLPVLRKSTLRCSPIQSHNGYIVHRDVFFQRLLNTALVTGPSMQI